MSNRFESDHSLPPQLTGHAHPECYARELADCCTKLSGEHYVTEAILRTVFGSGEDVAEVTGLPWQRGGSGIYGTDSLTGKVLCKRHNEQLSRIDDGGLALVLAAESFYTGFNNGLDEDRTVAGDLVERWMLKTLCGCVVSGNMVNQAGQKQRAWVPPRDWLGILFRGAAFRPPHGLHLVKGAPKVSEPLSRQVLRLAPMWDGSGTTPIGLRMWLFNVEYALFMDEEVYHAAERLHDRSIYRPGSVWFRDPTCVKRLNFTWDGRRPGLEHLIIRQPHEG